MSLSMKMPYLLPYQGKVTIEPIPLTLYAIISKVVGIGEQTTILLRSFLQLTDFCVAHTCDVIYDVIAAISREVVAVLVEILAHVVCLLATLVIALIAHSAMLCVLCVHAAHVVLRKGLGLGTSGKLLARKPLRRLFFSSLEILPFILLAVGFVRYLGVGHGNEWKVTGGLFEHFLANGIRKLHDEFHEVVVSSRS